MANKVTGPSAGKGRSPKKGSARGKGVKKGTTKGAKSRSRSMGPRSGKGWSGPTAPKQMRGSNTTAHAKRPTEPKKEPQKKGPGKQSKATAETRPSKGGQRRTPPKGATSRVQKANATPEDDPDIVPEVSTDGDLHGPDKIEQLKSTADKMVVGERTVIHHAARYGIIRGMTWTVILSALLFWLPVAGPAIAGYVGGRKAGGPLRAVIAVIIPAMVMLIILAAVSENMDLIPTSMTAGTEVDLDSVAAIPTAAVPLLSGLEQSINTWAATPPDVVFIMLAFAILGGSLSSLRRREEETVIEKVGIPLGELKERILREEAEKDGTTVLDPPSRWHPHKMLSGTAAAHDSVNEMVDDIAMRVYQYMQFNEMVDENGAVVAKAQTRKRVKKTISTGDEGPHYEDLVYVTDAPAVAAAGPATKSKRSRGGARAAVTTTPRTAGDAIVGDAEDWVVVNTNQGRRPVRVVHSPMVAVARERTITELEEEVEPPVVYEEPPTLDIAEPVMHVEQTKGGIFRRSKQKVVYSSLRSPERSLVEEMTTTDYSPPTSPHGYAGVVEEPLEVPALGRNPTHRNYERLPIAGAIMATIEGEAEAEEVRYGRVTSLEEPTVHDTMQAGSIAESAARELAEMARFEEGPDLEPEDDDMPPEAKPRARSKPRSKAKAKARPSLVEEVEVSEEDLDGLEEEHMDVLPEEDELPVTKPTKQVRSTARRVKHPTGSLKKGSRKVKDGSYDDDLSEEGEVQWEAPSLVEEEDMFNPRHLEDAPPVDEETEEGSEAWAEEERIAALVREREEWDRL